MGGPASSAPATVSESPPPSGDSPMHPVVSLFAAAFWVILWLLDCARWILAFVTISVPYYVYAILSYSLTLTLDFKAFFFLFVVTVIAVSFYVRFKYLNIHERLREPPLEKPDAKELHPDVNAQFFDDVRGGAFHSYLDEFLLTIRVFGFLEKPVFDELTRHLQTRRLIAGDTLSLDSDKSFYSVIDGTVQVFAKRDGGLPQQGSWEEEEMNGYQLLNEVTTGGTLSSLFTILSLFTEDVKISWPSDDDTRLSPPTGRSRPGSRQQVGEEWDLTGSEVITSPESRTTTPPLNLIRRNSVSSESTFTGLRPPLPHSRSARLDMEKSRVLQDTVARATEDTTLAVIPAEAFRRVTKKFPKASAHIVQVILTRFSRVTFNAAHKYLGLTSELLRAERSINEMACHPLPAYFYEAGGLQKLRQTFDEQGPMNDAEEEESIDTETEKDYFSIRRSAVNSPASTFRALPASSSDTSTSSHSAHIHVLSESRQTGSPESGLQAQPSGPIMGKHHHSREMVQAGDLHTTAVRPQDLPARLMRLNSVLLSTPHHSTHPKDSARRRARTMMFSLDDKSNNALIKGGSELDNQPQGNQDFNLRDEVMGCIAKSIGLHQPPLSTVQSPNTSPTRSTFSPGALTPGSANGRHQIFPSSYGSLSRLDSGNVESSQSVSSLSSAHGGDDQYISGLHNEVEILFFPAGSTLVRSGEQNAGLFYVIDGFLDISMPDEEVDEPFSSFHERHGSTVSNSTLNTNHMPSGRKKDSQASYARKHGINAVPKKHLFTVHRGGIAGYLASLSGIASYVDIRAKTDTYVGFLPSHALNRLLEKRPIVLLTLSKRLLSLLSPLVLQIDSALDWTHVSAGQVLWRPGDPSDCLYIVINGRLRTLRDGDGNRVSIAGEYGQGDAVGELDVITHAKRSLTLHAIRDTELVRVPLTLFNAISRNPQATVHLLRRLASRVRDELDIPAAPKGTKTTDLGRKTFNLKTVAILPVNSNVPVVAFSRKLHAALEGIGAPTSYLNSTSVLNHVGRQAFTRLGPLKAAGWLAEQEQKYRIVLYVVDSPVGSQWTQTCIRQADYIMIVGMGENAALGEYERLLLTSKNTARKELVLLHPERYVVPGSTRAWLKIRPWIHAHFHVELPGIPSPKQPSSGPSDPAPVAALKKVKDRVQTELQRLSGAPNIIRPPRPEHASDFARLARRLCGRTIGVVLGGGGARGVSHLGVLRALEDYGIPVDHIGGTSIGSFIGALYAREGDLLASNGRAKAFASRMGNIWRMLADVTYPIVAYTTGHAFNRAIYKSFYDLHIEDMWLPYFCNSTNILQSCMEVHETGYAWRYIRASMTLVGLLPPLCDNGQMLVDGGYVDNLPVSTMMSLGAHAVFAVDVGSVDDTSPRNFGDSVSGWWLFLNRWNPFYSSQVPPITEIQSRLAYVSSVKTLEDAKLMNGCLYMRMPVQDYGTLQWDKFTEIQGKGYTAALEMLANWDQEHKLPSLSDVRERDSNATATRKGRGQRRNSI